MLRYPKRLSLLASLLLAASSAFGFSLLGPNNEPWQAPEIGYNPAWDALPTAPKNIAEEYRRNTPVLYYTFDANFLEYFGAEGVRAVDDAFNVFNRVALTNVSNYSFDLHEWPLQVTRENYTATALQILDIKSQTMKLIIEQLGLAEPERYIWTLHTRFNDGSAPCPGGMQYSVVKRNFDPVPTPLNQFQSSSYVNGTLYSYYILEVCNPPNPLAEALEFPVDPLDFTYTAVASGPGSVLTTVNMGLPIEGRFYINLTRDDIGGLRYLMRASNVNFESPGSQTISYITNPVPQLLFTSNLTQLAQLAVTNPPAVLQGLYPGLGITSSTNWWRAIWVTNAIPVFTNSPFDPAYTPPRLVYITNRFQTLEQQFEHVFNNIFTVELVNGQWRAVAVTNLNEYVGRTTNYLQTVTIAASREPFAPAGSFAVTTNLTNRRIGTNTVVGEFFVMPTNACEVVILSPLLTITNATTNVISVATNTITVSNAVIVTNITETFVQQIVELWTNRAFSVLPVQCLQSNVAAIGGIESIRFERRDYDSLIGRYFEPFTNFYTLTSVTNYRAAPMRVARPVQQPDFLITAQDTSPGPAADPTLIGALGRGISFNTNGVAFYPGLAGPGTIEGPTQFTFNKGGPIWYNDYLYAYLRELAEFMQIPLLIWGSFDGSTNAPIVFPNGVSLESIEHMILWQVSPMFLPEVSMFEEFPETTLVATGGTAPYTFYLAPNSPSLPPGITLSPDGTISGTPTQRGTFDFIIRVTDAENLHIDRPYFLKVNW